MTTISCRDVAVAFGGVDVLCGIDLEVPSGGWVTVVGPNGAGKSTLLRAVGGIVDAGGSIDLGGRSVAGMARRELARLVALVPQEPVIPPGMPVLDYVLLGRTAHLGFFAAETTSDVSLALEALSDLREQGTQIALVVREGAAPAVVTIADLLSRLMPATARAERVVSD